jgi:histidine triad (HIT) family protein
MAETVYAKILRGELPCHRVYEDDRVLVFLDICPASCGHTLIIPKEPAETLDQLSDESAAAIGRILPRVCRAVMKATGTTAYNVLQNNGAMARQVVKHVHFHVIPRVDEETGLRASWTPGQLDHDAGAALAARMSELLAT